MATPIINQDSQWDGLIRLLGQHEKVLDESGSLLGTRRDVFYAMIIMGSNAPTVHDAVQLFWNIYQPRLYAFPDAEDRPKWAQNLSEADIHRSMNPPALHPQGN